MSAPAAVIVHGTAVTNSIVDEADILITSLEKSGTREKKSYKGLNGADKIWKYVNPILTLNFSGYIAAFTGFADTMAGTAVTTLANFLPATPTITQGFDSSEGIIVYEDPTVTENNEGDLPEISFTAVHGPFLA